MHLIAVVSSGNPLLVCRVQRMDYNFVVHRIKQNELIFQSLIPLSTLSKSQSILEKDPMKFTKKTTVKEALYRQFGSKFKYIYFKEDRQTGRQIDRLLIFKTECDKTLYLIMANNIQHILSTLQKPSHVSREISQNKLEMI